VKIVRFDDQAGGELPHTSGCANDGNSNCHGPNLPIGDRTEHCRCLSTLGS
jgi:hypothetical protein